jgi:plasmid maintenance system antidote protein VapI
MGMKDNKPKVTQNRLFEPGDRGKPKVINKETKQEENNKSKMVDLNNLDEESANYISEVVKKHVTEQLREVMSELYDTGMIDYKTEIHVNKTVIENIIKNQGNKNKLTNLEVGSGLDEYIKDNGISKTILGDYVGISRGTLFNIIKNPNTVSLINAKKLSIALGIDIEKLFPTIYSEE